MTGRERFQNMVLGRPLDRRPFGALLSLYGAGLTGCPLERHYNDAASYALGQDAVMQEVAPDFLTGPFLLAGFGEAFGSSLHYADRYVPTLLRPAIASAADIPSLSVPDVDSHPRILYFRDSIRRMAAAHGKDVLVIAIVLNPLDLPLMILGPETWLRTVLTDKEGTRRMLDVTVPFFARLCRALSADGADVIAMPVAFFTRAVTTERMVRQTAMPVLQEALPLLQGPVLFHHTGSTFIDHIGLLDTVAGATAYTLDSLDDIAVARGRIRGESLLLAGFDGPSLHTLTPEGIHGRCLELLHERGDDVRFLPAATGTDVDMRTPVDCLVAIRRAVEEYGSG